MDQAAAPIHAPDAGKKKLSKDLGLWDVYCISTGAMFSSGFFLLPGLATAYAGPSTVLAYLVAGLLMIPAMLSMAELSTALPRAGGTYYFLDRSLGPGAGTVGGLGTWLALVLKSAFALLGMGAYLAIAPGLSQLLPVDEGQRLWVIKGLAVALTVAFAALNIFGAKETTRLQSILVIALLSVLSFFVIQGLYFVFFSGEVPGEELREQYTPFFHAENGFGGFFATVGLVFVSYAGLTKVASVSEEVKRPDRNLPLGMILSLVTATTIYVVGVAIMIATVDPGPLRGDYTPVATSAERFFDWLPGSVGLILIVVAALAAFASTGNAGILSASRYPLAMGRDRLLSPKFNELGKFGTPTLGIVVTAGLMIFFIVALSAEGVAKVASAFNLFVFGLMNVSVIVMREAKIDSYDPGFRSPLYPWMQLAGVLGGLWLLFGLGGLAITALTGSVVVGTA
ncbi:MAG: APC family permease, partial [Planctomycetota bacterium]